MRSARSAPIPRSHGQIGRERSGGSYCGVLCAPDDLRRGGRVDRPLAGEHHRRRLGGLGSDAAAARDRLEVGVHRGSGLVAIGRLLRERAHDDEVEVRRGRQAGARTARAASPRGASSRSRPGCRP